MKQILSLEWPFESHLFYTLEFLDKGDQMLFHLNSSYKIQARQLSNVYDRLTVLSRLVQNFIQNELTNSMEQSPSWESNSHSESQEILRLLWNLKTSVFFTRN